VRALSRAVAAAAPVTLRWVARLLLLRLFCVPQLVPLTADNKLFICPGTKLLFYGLKATHILEPLSAQEGFMRILFKTHMMPLQAANCVLVYTEATTQ
jgi:hypothetical protein